MRRVVQQVDNGRYIVVNDHTMRNQAACENWSGIRDIMDGSTLALTPVVTLAERKQALRTRLE